MGKENLLLRDVTSLIIKTGIGREKGSVLPPRSRIDMDKQEERFWRNSSQRQKGLN